MESIKSMGAIYFVENGSCACMQAGKCETSFSDHSNFSSMASLCNYLAHVKILEGRKCFSYLLSYCKMGLY